MANGIELCRTLPVNQCSEKFGSKSGSKAVLDLFEIRCKSLIYWRTHEELNLKPADP